MRPAAQLIAHCWLDEEARLSVSREQGIISNINDPLQCHVWPNDSGGIQEPGQSLSSLGSVSQSVKSLAVTRLSEAISKAYVINGVVPSDLRNNVLDTDTRGIIARILLLIGVIDAYNATPPGYVGPYHQFDLGLGEGSNIVLEQDSSLLIAPPGAGEQQQQLDIIDMDADADADGNADADADGINESKAGGEPSQEININNINSSCIDNDNNMNMNMNAPAPVSPLGLGHGHGQTSYEEGEGQGFSASQVPTVIISNDPGLNPSDRQVVAIANHYNILRQGEWWKTVADDLQSDGIEPIEIDQKLIQNNIKSSFNSSFMIQLEQMELHGQEIDNKKDIEDSFLLQILAKKDQQIKTMYLKKKGKGGTTANPHATRPY